ESVGPIGNERGPVVGGAVAARRVGKDADVLRSVQPAAAHKGAGRERGVQDDSAARGREAIAQRRAAEDERAALLALETIGLQRYDNAGVGRGEDGQGGVPRAAEQANPLSEVRRVEPAGANGSRTVELKAPRAHAHGCGVSDPVAVLKRVGDAVVEEE